MEKSAWRGVRRNGLGAVRMGRSGVCGRDGGAAVSGTGSI